MKSKPFPRGSILCLPSLVFALCFTEGTYGQPTTFSVLAEFPKLGLRILVKGRDSDIKACSLHRFSFDVIKRAPQLGSGDSFRRQSATWERDSHEIPRGTNTLLPRQRRAP